MFAESLTIVQVVASLFALLTFGRIDGGNVGLVNSAGSKTWRSCARVFFFFCFFLDSPSSGCCVSVFKFLVFVFTKFF